MISFENVGKILDEFQYFSHENQKQMLRGACNPNQAGIQEEHFNYVKYGFICGMVEHFKVKNDFAFKREQAYLLFAKFKECRLLMGYHGSHFSCSLLSLR